MKTRISIIAALLLAAAVAPPAGASSTTAATAAMTQAATGVGVSAVAGGGHYGHRSYSYARYGFRLPYFSLGFGHGYRPYYYGSHYRYRGYGHHRYGYGGYRWAPRYRYYRGDQSLGGLDLKVKPKKTEVFVDGTYVGTAGQYDGWPSYLWLEEGLHQVILHREGFETVVREIEIQPDLVADLNVRMVAGEATDPESLMLPEPEMDSAVMTDGPGASDPGTTDGPGRLRVAVSPQDAVIYLDGHFFGIASELNQVTSGLVIAPGEHTVEIVRPGYRTARRTVDVSAGAQTDLEISLDRR